MDILAPMIAEAVRVILVPGPERPSATRARSLLGSAEVRTADKMVDVLAALEAVPDGVVVACVRRSQEAATLISWVHDSDDPRPILLLPDTRGAVDPASLPAHATILEPPFGPAELSAQLQPLALLAGMGRWKRQAERAEKRLEQEQARFQALARFVTPEVVRHVREGKDRVPTRHLELSVLFSDIRGFTDATSFATPADTVQLLNDYLPEVHAITGAFHGVLDKFMGDGILVHFAHMTGEKHPALRAVLAALRIQERLEELKVEWFERGHLPVGVGLGVATGWVTVSTLGKGERLDHTVIGGTVNLAARLQGLARGGEIVVDHATASQLEAKVSLSPSSQVPIKGFEAPVEVFRVLGLSDAPRLEPVR